MKIIKVKLKAVGGNFTNLLTTEKPIYSDDFIAGINVQGVEGEGTVYPHNHFIDDHIESIRPTQNSHYPGLNDPRVLIVGNTRVVPYTTEHGSIDKIASGQWLSTKVNHSQVGTAIHAIYEDNDSTLQVYAIKSGILMQIAISDDLKKLENMVGKPQIVLGLPEISKLVEGFEYEALKTKDYKSQSESFGRYMAILKD